MQNTLVILLVIGVFYITTAVTAISRPFTCPTKDGHFADISNCSKFYHCSEWTAYSKECSDGLYWDIEKDECNYPHDTNCDPSKPFRCPLKEGTFADWNTCDGFYSCRRNRGTYHKCPNGLHFHARDGTCDWPQYAECQTKPNPKICDAPNIKTFDERNCNCYFECDEELRPTAKCCNADQLWNELEKTCDEPLLVDCFNYRTKRSTSTKQYNQSELLSPTGQSQLSCTQPDGLFPFPNNCSKFIQCGNNIPYEKTCPDGLHFNPNIQACDWPANAGCTEETPEDSAPVTTAAPTTTTAASVPTTVTNATTTTTTPSTTTVAQTTTTTRLTTVASLPTTVAPGNPEDGAPPNYPVQCENVGDYHRDPSNCSCFYLCDAGNFPAWFCCPDNLLFNPNLNVCDWPQNVSCNDTEDAPPIGSSTTASPTTQQSNVTQTTAAPIQTTTQSVSSASPPEEAPSECADDFVCPVLDDPHGCDGPKSCLYPYKPDCTKFIQCEVWGYKHIKDCANETNTTRLRYNDNIKECDYTVNVPNCCTPSPNTTTTIKPNPPEDSPEETSRDPETTTAQSVPQTSPQSSPSTTTTTQSPEEEEPENETSEQPEKTTSSQTSTSSTATSTASTPEDEEPEQTSEGSDTTTTQSVTLTTPQEEAPPETCLDDFVCPVLDNKTACNGPKDCLYPYKPDCTQFIQCDAWGGKYIRECANETETTKLRFNDAIKQCDFSVNVPDCCTPPENDPENPNTTTVPPVTQTSPQSTSSASTPEEAPEEEETSQEPDTTTQSVTQTNPQSSTSITTTTTPEEEATTQPPDTTTQITSTSSTSVSSTSGSPGDETTTESQTITSTASTPSDDEPEEETSEPDTTTQSVTQTSPQSTSPTTTPEAPGSETTTQSNPSTTTPPENVETTTESEEEAPPDTCVDDFVCPVLDDPNACDGPKDCLYPYKPDCTQFIQCNAGGYKALHFCANESETTRLRFNDEIKQCDYPINVPNCCTPPEDTPEEGTTSDNSEPDTTTAQSITQTNPQSNTSITTTTTPEEETPENETSQQTKTTTQIISTSSTSVSSTSVSPGDETTTESQTTTSTASTPLDEEPEETSEEPDTTTQSVISTTPPEETPPECVDDFVCPVLDDPHACDGPTDCLYPYKPDCTQFIQCDAGGNKKLHFCANQSETTRLRFNDEIKQCDYPINVPNCCTPPEDTPEEGTTSDKEPDTTTSQSVTQTNPQSSTSTTTTTTPEEETPENETSQPPETTTQITSTSSTSVSSTSGSPGDETTTESQTTTSTASTPSEEEPEEETTTPSQTSTSSTATSTASTPEEDDTTTQAVTQTSVQSTSATSPTEQEPTTSQPETTSSPPEEAPEPPSCTTPPPEEELDFTELCRASCSVAYTRPHPNNTARYILCNGNSSSAQNCSAGLLYDQNRLTCDYIGLVDPPTTTTTTTEAPQTTESRKDSVCVESDGMYQDKTDCRFAYRCVDFVAQRLQCPSGLLFNENISNCDLASNVYCYDGSNRHSRRRKRFSRY